MTIASRKRAKPFAARQATDKTAIDRKVMIAERYADQAWSLAEAHDVVYVPSSLWKAAAEKMDRL